MNNSSILVLSSISIFRIMISRELPKECIFTNVSGVYGLRNYRCIFTNVSGVSVLGNHRLCGGIPQL